MRIDRVQIEEGFLDGLDVSFTAGLNVIIGARGTGKTSLIELVRFCLGVPGYTGESQKRSLNHALSVLASGQVTVTLTDGGREVLVTRTAGEDEPRTSAPFASPIVFSQTEIETVGLRHEGRIRLLDGFDESPEDAELRETAVRSEVRSLTAEVEALRREIEDLSGRVKELPGVDREITGIVPQERAVAKISADAKEKKELLDEVSAMIARLAARVVSTERFRQGLSRWHTSLSSVIANEPQVDSVTADEADLLANSRESVERAKRHLEKASSELGKALSESASILRSAEKEKIHAEGRARELRKEVEALQEGAGAIVRQGQQLRERKAQLESLKSILGGRRESLEAPVARRDAALELLDSIRNDRFERRDSIAKRLTKTLGPQIRVRVSRAGQFEAFAAAIGSALKGSGLRYNELSNTLAKNVSPRELLEAVDSNDVDGIVAATGIAKGRAARVVDWLRDRDLGVIGTAAVEDTVALELLDGPAYKGIRDLSTGQRCTVVLPLVLQHGDRVLVVDQPEDHIDNAFIADTLIASLLARNLDGQIIVTTHNPNIPVLGNADRVIQMGSDGRRGFALLASGLHDPAVVGAITAVMEGGAEAFRKRARFYRQRVEE